MLPSHLECSVEPAHRFSADTLATYCLDHNAPLFVRYPQNRLERARLAGMSWTMWRYREMMPIAEGEEPVSLGEGCTPLLALTGPEEELPPPRPPRPC